MNVQAAETLIQCGADGSVQADSGIISLHYAVLKCPSVICRPVSNKVAHLKNCDIYTTLHISTKIGNLSSTSEVVVALIQSNSLQSIMKLEDNFGLTSLRCASLGGCLAIIQKLPIHLHLLIGENRARPARIAAHWGHLDSLCPLIDNGLKQKGNEFFYRAVMRGQILIVQHFLVSENSLSSNFMFQDYSSSLKAS